MKSELHIVAMCDISYEIAATCYFFIKSATKNGYMCSTAAALTARLCAGADAEDAPVHANPGGRAGAALRH